MKRKTHEFIVVDPQSESYVHMSLLVCIVNKTSTIYTSFKEKFDATQKKRGFFFDLIVKFYIFLMNPREEYTIFA